VSLGDVPAPAGEGVVVSLLHADPRGLIVQNEAYDPRSDR
jgi:hypothetical protein